MRSMIGMLLRRARGASRLKSPILLTFTALDFSSVVSAGATQVEIFCVGAGFDGTLSSPGTPIGQPDNGTGGAGGGAIPRTTIPVSPGSKIVGKVGQSNGDFSFVSIAGQTFTTQGLVGGAGGTPGAFSSLAGGPGGFGIGDAGPGGGGGNWGSSAYGGNGGSNSAGVRGGGGASGGAAAVAGFPRDPGFGDSAPGSKGQVPGGGGGAGSAAYGLPAGTGARGEIRLKFT